eukprot:379902-Pyramimonas_sp.AAC.1
MDWVLRHPAAFLLPAADSHGLYVPSAGAVEEEAGVDTLSLGGVCAPPPTLAAASHDTDGVFGGSEDDILLGGGET